MFDFSLPWQVLMNTQLEMKLQTWDYDLTTFNTSRIKTSVIKTPRLRLNIMGGYAVRVREKAVICSKITSIKINQSLQIKGSMFWFFVFLYFFFSVRFASWIVVEVDFFSFLSLCIWFSIISLQSCF